MPPSVLISVLSWDSPRYLANLFDNLDGVTPSFEGRTRYHIRVLDQGSGPETTELIRAFMARGRNRSAELLRENIGFARGHNRVFDSFNRRGHFDFFLVLNQDVLFGRPTWLDRMVEGMADERIAIAGPTVWRLTADGSGMETDPRPDLGRAAPYCVHASIAIIRTSAIERFGLFDTAFTPAYFEDVDLGRRYIHAGLQLAWIDVPHVHAYLGAGEKLIRRKQGELAARFGPFRERNQRLIVERWLDAAPPAVTPETVRQLWPGVYQPRPRPQRMSLDDQG
jgi:GT2 family glycosyltransferase